MVPDDSKPFHFVSDASNFAIGCALMQFDDEGRAHLEFLITTDET